MLWYCGNLDAGVTYNLTMPPLGLQDSLGNMSKIADLLSQISCPSASDIEQFVKLSLWGNKTDLSLLKHFNLELADVQVLLSHFGQNCKYFHCY